MQRDLDSLEKCVWTAWDLNKVKWNVLHVGWDNPQYQDSLGYEWVVSIPMEKDLEILMEEKLDIWQQSTFAAQKANGILSCSKKKCDQYVEGDDFPPLLCTGKTSPRLLHPALRLSALKIRWMDLRGSRWGPWKWSKDQKISLVNKGWES